MTTLARQHKCLVFSVLDFRKVGKFAVSTESSKAKSVSASGGFRPLTP